MQEIAKQFLFNNLMFVIVFSFIKKVPSLILSKRFILTRLWVNSFDGTDIWSVNMGTILLFSLSISIQGSLKNAIAMSVFAGKLKKSFFRQSVVDDGCSGFTTYFPAIFSINTLCRNLFNDPMLTQLCKLRNKFSPSFLYIQFWG